MKKKYITISLYIIIPFTLSGLSLLWIILTDRLVRSYSKFMSESWSFALWGLTVVVASYIITLLIIWVVLKPVRKFVKTAESLPVYPKKMEEEVKTKDDIERFERVFDQITTILTKVEAKELFPGMVGQSRIMRGVFTQIIKVAPTDSTVLILGESGTGKELVATGLYEHSLRKGKPFIKINCVAIPESLLESELFGHEKGAFTGAVS
ncbi:MAG: sigma-54 factor interaction domain-containing protein, partial [Syntrophaceae bacterium]|nr:sigma-54 factor interaction domain-containing protein [Syntrophaceae bacterium]